MNNSLLYHCEISMLNSGKITCSDFYFTNINIVTLAFFWLMSRRYIFSCSFTFTFEVSPYLKWISYTQHMLIFDVCIQCDNLCSLTGVLKPFIIATVPMVRCKSTILLFLLFPHVPCFPISFPLVEWLCYGVLFCFYLHYWLSSYMTLNSCCKIYNSHL